MKDALSRIYFDDIPVKLLGDEARPPLDRIVRAGGKVPADVDVIVLTKPKDRTGQRLPDGEIIDRTVEPGKPIYLRSVKKRTLDPAGDQPLNIDPVIAQLGLAPRLAPDDPFAAALRQSKQADRQAIAEAEAEERKEEDREQDDNLQDEQEDLRQSDEDRDTQG